MAIAGGNKISAVYGDALFEAAAEAGIIAQTYEEVLEISQILLQNQDFLRLLYHPRVTRDEKLQILERSFQGRISEELMGFLHIVVEKSRQEELLSMFRHFTERVKAYRKAGKAFVTSAVELSPEQKKRLEDRLLETTHYLEVQMYYAVEPEILGGLIVRVGDRVMDNSIKTRLDTLERELSGLQLT